MQIESNSNHYSQINRNIQILAYAYQKPESCNILDEKLCPACLAFGAAWHYFALFNRFDAARRRKLRLHQNGTNGTPVLPLLCASVTNHTAFTKTLSVNANRELTAWHE